MSVPYGVPQQSGPGAQQPGHIPQPGQPPQQLAAPSQPAGTFDLGLILALAAAGLSLIAYFCGFAEKADGYGIYLVLLATGGALTALSVLPREKVGNTLPAGAVLSFAGALAVLHKVITDPGTTAAIVVVVLVAAILQMLVTVAALLFKLEIIKFEPKPKRPAYPQPGGWNPQSGGFPPPFGQQPGQPGAFGQPVQPGQFGQPQQGQPGQFGQQGQPGQFGQPQPGQQGPFGQQGQAANPDVTQVVRPGQPPSPPSGFPEPGQQQGQQPQQGGGFPGPQATQQFGGPPYGQG